MAGDKAAKSVVHRSTTSVRAQQCSWFNLARRGFYESSVRAGVAYRSPPPAVGRDALVGDPHALGQFAGLPEHVDRDTATRIPVAADAKPFRLDLGGNPLADHDRAILVEGAVIAKAGDIEFQRFGFQQPLARRVVDHEMREIRLASDRAYRGEFRCG